MERACDSLVSTVVVVHDQKLMTFDLSIGSGSSIRFDIIIIMLTLIIPLTIEHRSVALFNVP